jgi:uncharacterized membrane protein YczE
VPRDPAPIRLRVATFVAGTVAVGVGVGMMVRADLGVTPNDVLTTGFGDLFGIDLGLASALVAAILAALAWVLGRPPSIGTVAGAVLVGGSVSLSLALSGDATGWGRPVVLAVGLLVLWTGIVAIVTSNAGTGPLELLMLALGDRGWRLDVARWVIEVSIFAAGLLLGGDVGIGTALFALCTGPVLAQALPRTMRWMGTDAVLPPAVVPLER